MTESTTVDLFQAIEVGNELPQRAHTPDNVQLMLYNAILWNAHRIHFDEPYAREVEGYPGLVIAGPMLGDWLHQCLEEWLRDAGRIVSIDYSNRIASYIGETLTAGGSVVSRDTDSRRATVDVWIRNENGEVITPGSAIVEFS
jgi:3-methylfumaryl-CoA hydratase